MEKDIEHIKKALNRNRFAVFAVVGFLGLITYLLIVVSQSVTEQASISTTSMASVIETPAAPLLPIESTYPNCSNYVDYIEARRADAREAAKKIRYRLPGEGDEITGSCEDYLYVPAPTGSRGRTDGEETPSGPVAPAECAEIARLHTDLTFIQDFMRNKCLQCPDVTPTVYITPRISAPATSPTPFITPQPSSSITNPTQGYSLPINPPVRQ